MIAGLPLFLVMCVIWGLTWIAIKTGVAAVPPLLFAGTRFVAAGVLLLVWLRVDGTPTRPPLEDRARFLLSAGLVIAVSYSLLFWGMQHVPSGLAAIVNLSLIPVGLFGLGLAHGEERFSRRRAAAVLVGVAGLLVLFGPHVSARDRVGLAGLAAIVAATLTYCWGSILSRPLLQRSRPELVSAVTSLWGGLLLIAVSLAVETLDPARLARELRPAVLASWIFLVVGGSLVAFTIYLRLLRDWGALRAGTYAFVSPVVAVTAGVALLGEPLAPSGLAGMSMLLTAAWLTLR